MQITIEFHDISIALLYCITTPCITIIMASPLGMLWSPLQGVPTMCPDMSLAQWTLHIFLKANKYFQLVWMSETIYSCIIEMHFIQCAKYEFLGSISQGTVHTIFERAISAPLCE